jgi:hypothetical protein
MGIQDMDESNTPNTWDKSQDLKEELDSWEKAIQHFKDNYMPMFSSYQLTFSVAFQLYMMNKLYCTIDDLLENLEDGKE